MSLIDLDNKNNSLPKTTIDAKTPTLQEVPLSTDHKSSTSTGNACQHTDNKDDSTLYMPPSKMEVR